MKESHKRLATKAFRKLGCTTAEAGKLVRITGRLMNRGIRNYVNLKARENIAAMQKLFSVTQPKINILDSEEMVVRQLFAKNENFSDVRVKIAAENCMYVVLDEVLGDFNYVELIIGGAKDRILTAESDIDIPVVTNCPSWGQCQLATVVSVIALAEVHKEIPCGSCTRVFNEEQMLTTSSLSQHYVKTAILVPEPVYDNEVFFTHFEEKSYSKLRRIAGDEETVHEMYCSDLERYNEKTRRKIGNALKVKTKDLLKVIRNDLTRFFAHTKGLNALRGTRFNELYLKASKIYPSLEDIEPILGLVLKHAGGDPEKAISAHKVSKQISEIFETLQVFTPRKIIT